MHFHGNKIYDKKKLTTNVAILAASVCKCEQLILKEQTRKANNMKLISERKL